MSKLSDLANEIIGYHKWAVGPDIIKLAKAALVMEEEMNRLIRVNKFRDCICADELKECLDELEKILNE